MKKMVGYIFEPPKSFGAYTATKALKFNSTLDSLFIAQSIGLIEGLLNN